MMHMILDTIIWLIIGSSIVLIFSAIIAFICEVELAAYVVVSLIWLAGVVIVTALTFGIMAITGLRP
jgi:hypothetical protein